MCSVVDEMTRLLAFVGCGLCLLASVAETAQRDTATLPRRGWFGVALGPHPDGAAVTAVVEGSTAAAEGLLAGDVIRAVDAITVRAPGDVIAGIGRHAAGETAVIELVREDARVLVLHGQYDEGTFATDHARIASSMNARRAGAAVHRELQGLDHCWSSHDSLEASRDRCGSGQRPPRSVTPSSSSCDRRANCPPA